MLQRGQAGPPSVIVATPEIAAGESAQGHHDRRIATEMVATTPATEVCPAESPAAQRVASRRRRNTSPIVLALTIVVVLDSWNGRLDLFGLLQEGISVPSARQLFAGELPR